MIIPLIKNHSAFRQGLKKTIGALVQEVQTLYLENQIPWVVGYSGGKDSSATLQLVWLAIQKLTPEQRTKPVHVISTDTLVENPVVASWVNSSLIVMGDEAIKQGLPITPHRLTPEIKDSFWVNLIGHGYAAPRPKFRWCTSRLKINPSNLFITNTVSESGKAILVLGTRKAESRSREKTMAKYEARRIIDKLSPNASLPGALVYSPIENWSNDDVWLFLMQFKNPWGQNNKGLLTMYSGASTDGECPLVVDTTTPSCGNSRFGCWVCTMVDKDKSMQAMIQNDEEKEWMLPLLEFRNMLDIENDRHLRDYRRKNGKIQFYKKRVIPGPYVGIARINWLSRLLICEQLTGQSLISIEELNEIQRIWACEGIGCASEIYLKSCGKLWPGNPPITVSKIVPPSKHVWDLEKLPFFNHIPDFNAVHIPSNGECFCGSKAILIKRIQIKHTAAPAVVGEYCCQGGHWAYGEFKMAPFEFNTAGSFGESAGL